MEYYKYLNKLYKQSKKSFLEILRKRLETNNKSFVITANLETFKYANKDAKLLRMLNDEEVILVPDSIGVVKAANMFGIDIKERIAGIDIANELLQIGNELEKSVYFFGSKQEVIDDLLKVVKKHYPKLKIVGSKNGYVKDKDKVMEEIIQKNPDIILVALGIPEQEKLIYKHLKKFKKGIFIGVGGSFDVISEHKKRAPKIFIKMNLEWLYRIIKEPSRLKRFYNNNIKFMLEIKKERKMIGDKHK